jgi:hypothetical protein
LLPTEILSSTSAFQRRQPPALEWHS